MVNSYLIDTHAALWWWTEPENLSRTVFDILADKNNQIFVSSASVWEMATKHRKGKLGKAEKVLQEFAQVMQISEFNHLPVTWQHAKLSGEFEFTHADPFDRMIAAQAYLEGFVLLTKDSELGIFPAKIIW